MIALYVFLAMWIPFSIPIALIVAPRLRNSATAEVSS